MKRFSTRLTELRQEKGIQQGDVATQLEISQALLSHYERGRRECRFDTLIDLANYYNVTCDYLLGRTDDRKGR